MNTADRSHSASLDRPAPGRGFASSASRAHRMPYGAEVQQSGDVRFRLWAPAAPSLQLALEGKPELLALTPTGDGWHELTTALAGVGTRYQFVLPAGMRVPDPASRHQPEDVHGPSEVVDPAAYAWTDTDWRGRPWRETVLYELHIGSFTAEGTFRSAIDRLDHLESLGVNAIEIMPIADFPGRRNWGYDGVLLYAPDSSYGRPEDLKALVEAAHMRGISVLLDVVYNHFGPDGNYLPTYAPQIYTNRHKTPWGEAIRYDGNNSRAVREFVIHNALYWIEEFHLDGLRLDAVHAIVDESPQHLLEELATRVRGATHGRPVHLILENEDNSAALLRRGADSSPVAYTAQWNDDAHYVLHASATGEGTSYYGDYVGDTEKLGRALAEGFGFQGELMPFRGSPRGEPSVHLSPDAFVAFIQNHDQIGNRAFGDRISDTASPAALRAIASVYLLLPQVPMLFMGEEWATARPFPFFCDFDGELGDAVSAGRREEFPQFKDATTHSRIPDPQADGTFASSKLDWDNLAMPAHAEWLDWYKRALDARRRHVLPLQIGSGGTYEVAGPGAVVVRWTAPGGGLTLVANLSTTPVAVAPVPSGQVVWQEGAIAQGGELAPWTVLWVRHPGIAS